MASLSDVAKKKKKGLIQAGKGSPGPNVQGQPTTTGGDEIVNNSPGASKGMQYGSGSKASNRKKVLLQFAAKRKK
jgi:hypothetical protein